MKKEVERCKTEIVVLKLQVDDIENERDNVQQELNSMQGYGHEFYNMTKCNQLERFTTHLFSKSLAYYFLSDTILEL